MKAIVNLTMQQVAKELKSHPFTLLTLLGLVCFGIWGYASYALASDVEQRFEALEEQVAENGDKIDNVSKLLLAESIRSLQRQICATTDNGVRAQLQRTMDTLQNDYQTVNDGSRYAVTRCENGA